MAAMQTGSALIRDVDNCVVPPGACALWWLGQHSFIVKLGATIVYIDPFLSPHKGRQVAPLLAPTEAVNAHLILGSHDHADHIDRPAWPVMAQAAPRARFVTPELLRRRIVAELGLPEERVAGLDLGLSVRVGEVAVRAIPAAHELLRRDPATGLHPFIGFIIEGNGFRLYHAGDCCLYEGQRALLRNQPCNLFILPINGRDAKRLAANCIGNMTYQEAADLAGDLRPGAVIPAHYEMFANNSVNVAEFADYVRVKYPRQRVLVPEHGVCTLIQ
jgi:L-ascorbate metabolism protein UlaG (beta-lactamase superfamily)